MIQGKNDLFQRIKNHSFGNPNDLDYIAKIELLEQAIDHSVKEACEDIMKTSPEVHLTYSGGVDSSLILMKILQQGFPLTAHTIGSRLDHPDIVHAKKFIEELKAYTNLAHKTHIIEASDKDIEESNKILGVNQKRHDDYFMLMKAIEPNTNKVIGCDIIDELMGGYYPHSRAENKREALNHFMSRLIPDHLSILDKMSSYFGIDVFLPYGSEKVMNCASLFDVNQLVDDTYRKKPIYEIARKNNVTKEVLERRKYGLCSALD